MNPNPDKSSRPVASGKSKAFFPPGSTGATTMRLRAELQHEEAKLRIFKIFMVLFVLCVGAFLVYSGISYCRESQAQAKKLALINDLIAIKEKVLDDNSTASPFVRARLLVELIDLRTEELMPLLSRGDLKVAEQANRRNEEEIARLAKVSLPAAPEQPGEDF
ncbi:MAG: hypothetical protein IKQ82_00105, partial [Lentisphaeria bacterium]|nr:hypothetical protein [Lentisphaeria bacterium]